MAKQPKRALSAQASGFVMTHRVGALRCALRCAGLVLVIGWASFAWPAQPCVAPPSGLISWWPGDNNSTDVISGHNGTQAGGATFAPGEVRSAFSFPTAGSIDIGYTTVATPVAITVGAWVNPTTNGTSAPSFFNWRPAANNTGVTLEQRFVGDGEVLWNVFGTGGAVSIISGVNLLPLNTWTYVAGTYDGTTSNLYFNGAVVGSGATSGPLAQIAASAKIGTNIVTNGAFQGAVDEVQVFGRALSAAEIQAIVNAGPSGQCHAVLDVDADGRTDALTDGLLIIRYLFGLTGSSLVAGAVSSGANRTTAPVIQNYLNQIAVALDIDGNSSTDALTDGLLVLRYLFGLRGASLIQGAVDPLGTRTTAMDIETYIGNLIK